MKTVAVIGCGKYEPGKEGWAIGHAHAEGYLETAREIKLLGVDLSPENLKAFGEKFKLPEDQLFASEEALYASCTPDVVSVCTWPALHHPMVMRALDKGVKAIACEKPFTLDVGEQREIEATANEQGAQIAVCHQRRTEAQFQLLKSVAHSGRLGSHLKVQAYVGGGWDILSWTTHWFDMANYFFDGGPDYVLAGMGLGDLRRYNQAVEEGSIICADYGDRGMATFLTGPGEEMAFRVEGSKGMAIIDEKANTVVCMTIEGVEVLPVPESDSGFGIMLRELIDTLDGGATPQCAMEHCALATEMAYAAQESARTGAKVSLPLDLQFAPLELSQRGLRSPLFGKKVLLYADHHFDSGGREGIAEGLGEMTGEALRVVPAEERGLLAEDFEGIDAVLIYHTQKEADETTRTLLQNWVGEKKPLLIVHAGLGAWPEWEEYTRWCGKVWNWEGSEHPHEATTITTAEGDPLNLGFTEAWLPKDEVFIKLKETQAIEVGMTCSISCGTYEVAWRLAEQSHIGAWMPGHRWDSWKVPAMREGLTRTLLSLM